jgi:hypothetical protein
MSCASRPGSFGLDQIDLLHQLGAPVSVRPQPRPPEVPLARLSVLADFQHLAPGSSVAFTVHLRLGSS